MPLITAADRRRWKAESAAHMEAVRREAFMEASRELAEELGQAGEPCWPRIAAVDLHPDLAAGVLRWDKAASISRPGRFYQMIQTASGWQHVTTDCPGWLNRATCHHIEEMNEMTMALTTTLSPGALSIIDDLDEMAVMRDVGAQISKAWVYEFPMGGQTIRGLSATGVEEAARELAKKGEALREIDVKIEYEDQYEARFLAQAGRFAISDTGGSVLLDVAIRGKRQPKTQVINDYEGTYPNRVKVGTHVEPDDQWYEKGVTKAVRNAKRALLPEQVQSYIIAQAVAAGRVAQTNGRDQMPAAPPRQALQQGRARPATTSTPPVATQGDCEHVPTFDEKSALMVCAKCGTVLDEPPGGASKLPL